MKDISDRIKEAMSIRNLRQAEIVERTGINKGALSSYLSGRYKPKQENIYRLAEALNVNEAWLMGADVPMERMNRSVNSRIVIPIYGRIAAGKPTEMMEDIIGEADITYLPSDHEYIALKINGRSMEPALMDGDIVIVSRQPDVENGEIAVVAVNGNDATCKRVYKYSNGVRLVPINPEFEPIILNKQEIDEIPVRIIGKVVESRHRWV